MKLWLFLSIILCINYVQGSHNQENLEIIDKSNIEVYLLWIGNQPVEQRLAMLKELNQRVDTQYMRQTNKGPIRLNRSKNFSNRK